MRNKSHLNIFPAVATNMLIKKERFMRGKTTKYFILIITVAALTFLAGCVENSNNVETISTESKESKDAVLPGGRKHKAEIIHIDAVYPDEKSDSSEEWKTAGENENDASTHNDEDNINSSQPETLDLGPEAADPVSQKSIEQYYKQASASAAYRQQMNGFYQAAMEKTLVSDYENIAFSPLNAYMAFSVLTEAAGGNTRKQFLDFLQAGDIESLRKQTAQLMSSNTAELRNLKSRLSTSLWLSDLWNYKEETLHCLAQDYCASSFIGNTESDRMNIALQKWFSDAVPIPGFTSNDLKLDPEAALSVMSTIYYQAEWEREFEPNDTQQKTFHGTMGDQTVKMMYSVKKVPVFVTDSFTSVGWPLKNSGYMYFCLPSPKTDVNELLSNPELYQAVSCENKEAIQVRLYVPKFKVISELDLNTLLTECGVSDVSDEERANFSYLTDDIGLFVQNIKQKAMVEIDEEGVTGAAFTNVELFPGAGFETEYLEITFDRPFLFVITGKDDSILFSGIIRNIQ